MGRLMEDKIDAWDFKHTAPSPNKDMKHDNGKYFGALPLQDFPLALKAVAEVGTFGANKYARHSWSTVENGYQRYEDAFHRHMLAHYGGETVDQETKLLHLAHMAWNILALLQMELKNEGGTFTPATGTGRIKAPETDFSV